MIGLRSHHVPQLLIVDDNAGDVGLTRTALSAAGIRGHVHVTRDGEEAMAYLQRTGKFASAPKPDLVLLDINLPRLSGIEVLEQSRRDDALSHVPIIMLSGSDADPDVSAAMRLGASAYLTKPVSVGDLSSAVRTINPSWIGDAPVSHAHASVATVHEPAKPIVAAPAANPAPIELLLVEDNAGDEWLVKAALARYSDEFSVAVARRLSDALALLDRSPVAPRVVLLDLHLPDSDGLATLAAFRARHPAVPVIVLTGMAGEALGVNAMREGAQDFLCKDEIVGKSLARVLRHAVERQRLLTLLERTALIDPLTDVYNRRGLELAVGSRLRASERANAESTMLFADVDGLKSINDTYGHERGDATIRAVADALRATLRTSDIIGRVGGDEFAAWMDGTADTRIDAFAARADLALCRIQQAAGWLTAPSVSIGVTLVAAGEQDLDAIFARADGEMYARRQARSRFSPV